MTGLKIWLTAHALTFIPFALLMNDYVFLVSAITMAVSIPAILLFNLWFAILNRVHLRQKARVALTLIIIPLITAINGCAFAFAFDSSGEACIMTAIPIVAALIAAAIFSPLYAHRQLA